MFRAAVLNARRAPGGLANTGPFDIVPLQSPPNAWTLTATQLDFETCRRYSIDILASDRYSPDEANARTAKLTLQLSLVDVNDNAPCIQVSVSGGGGGGGGQKGGSGRPRVPENRPYSQTNSEDNIVNGVLIEVADPDIEVFRQAQLLRCKAIARPTPATQHTAFQPTFFRVVPRTVADGGFDPEEVPLQVVYIIYNLHCTSLNTKEQKLLLTITLNL